MSSDKFVLAIKEIFVPKDWNVKDALEKGKKRKVIKNLMDSFDKLDAEGKNLVFETFEVNDEAHLIAAIEKPEHYSLVQRLVQKPLSDSKNKERERNCHKKKSRIVQFHQLNKTA